MTNARHSHHHPCLGEKASGPGGSAVAHYHHESSVSAQEATTAAATGYPAEEAIGGVATGGGRAAPTNCPSNLPQAVLGWFPPLPPPCPVKLPLNAVLSSQQEPLGLSARSSDRRPPGRAYSPPQLPVELPDILNP